MTIHNLVVLSLKQYYNTVTPYGIHTNILHAENHNVVQNNLPLRNAVRRSNLVAFPYYLTLTNARRARCAPSKHHEMPFERGIPCSSLLPLNQKCHRLHSDISDDTKKNHPSGWFLAMVDDDRIELPTSCL